MGNFHLLLSNRSAYVCLSHGERGMIFVFFLSVLLLIQYNCYGIKIITLMYVRFTKRNSVNSGYFFCKNKEHSRTTL